MGTRAGSQAGPLPVVGQPGIPDDPLTLGLIALGLVAVVAAVYGVFRWLRRPGARSFLSTLKRHDEVAVLMHPNPDPDAMACAMAVSRLATTVDTETTLQYPGEIRHQENRAFQTVLDLDLDRINRADRLAADAVVLVDHNRPRGFSGCEGVEPIAVVDHHPGGGEGRTYTDVRTEYGACATIFAEYFESRGADPGGDSEEVVLDTETATGLLYGILADTDHLTKGCSAAEFSAAAYLYPGVDEDFLDRIGNPQVSAEVLETKARAIRDHDLRASFVVCDVGSVPHVDAIPQAADELLFLEGVTAVVVVGDHDGTIHLSGRSRDDRVHMGECLEAAVDDIPMSGAGGHARMGGGQISIDHMNGIGPSDGLTREQLKERLFDAMGGETPVSQETETT